MSFHGGDIYSFENNMIDFSANINPYGISEKVKDKIKDILDSLAVYPDTECRKLRNALAEFHKTDYENIVCGNGGADVLFRLVHSIKPKKALVPVPCFTEYEKALNEVQCDIINYNTDNKDFKIKNDILDMFDESIDFVVICSPNNPTGAITEKSLLLKIAEKTLKNNTLFFIDECFNDMTDNPEKYSMLSEIEKFPNIFILKSMTKMYAIAGLRLGYGISSNKNLIMKVAESGQPWSVNTIASEIGITMLEDNEYREKFRKLIFKESEFLCRNLEKLGFKVFNPDANYIFFHSDSNIDFYSELIKYGILIRKCSDYKNLGNGYYRIAIRLHKDNEYLIEKLSEIIGRD